MQFAQTTLLDLLATYGYLAVFFFIAIESTGIPFPGETMLITAAIYAGHTHRLNIVLVIAAAAAGAIIGDNLGYAVGHWGGYRLLRRYGRYIRLHEKRLKLGQYLFLQHGGKIVFFGRFASILRTYAAFLAGTNRMPWWRFLVFNAAGGIVWATVFGTGAYVLGTQIHNLSRTATIVGGTLAVVGIVAFIIFLRRNEARLMAEADRALPDPL
ncbi:MAG: DedA family protein [Candidatus Dormibacteraeota bacterium]|nr:DedA family protein [Candidatus Dormibacteraeota bacterium]